MKLSWLGSGFKDLQVSKPYPYLYLLVLVPRQMQLI